MASNGSTDTGVVFKTTLSKELQQKAEAELNEKDKWRDRDIQALRDMVLANKALNCRTDGEFLVRFLRARKFDYDRAYAMIVNYYTMRAENVAIFKTMLPSNPSVRKALDSGVMTKLPHTDSEGRSIFYFRPGKWNPEDYTVYEILKCNVLSLELAIQSEETQVNGIVLIGNLADTGFHHLRNLDRNYGKLMISVLQEAFPLRFKGINFINESAIFGAVFALMKPFMKEKTVKRLTFHGSSLESLHKQFDPSILPEELGGKLPHGDQLAKDWRDKVVSNESLYTDLQQYSITLTRDSITSGGSSVDATSDCLIGSYRKLNVD